MKYIGRWFWKRFDRIDAMPEDTLDELCAKADAVDRVRAVWSKLPRWMQNKVGAMHRADTN